MLPTPIHTEDFHLFGSSKKQVKQNYVIKVSCFGNCNYSQRSDCHKNQYSNCLGRAECFDWEEGQVGASKASTTSCFLSWLVVSWAFDLW